MDNVVNEGISLGDIFKAIWKKKILVAIITGITLIAVFLAITFIYNPYKVTYSSQFELSFVGSSEGLYPTGEIFNYKDIVKKDNLLAAKNSNSKYNKIDIEKMYKKDGVKIQKVEATDEEANRYPEYVITISHSKVQDRDLMADFVSDLINITVQDIQEKSQKTDYVSDLKKYNDNIIYNDAITYLIGQTNVIIDGYNKMINTYGESYYVNDKTLKSYKNDAEKIIKSANLEYYLSEAEKKVYLTSLDMQDEYKDYAKARVASLLRKKQLNDEIINEYKNMQPESSSGGVDYTDQMDDIARENAEIVIELNSFINGGYQTNIYDVDLYELNLGYYDQNFTKQVDSIYNKIEELMTTYENNVRESNLKSILLSYDTNLIVVQSGVFNFVISALAGVFVGLIIGCIVAMVIELPKLNKKEEDVEA